MCMWVCVYVCVHGHEHGMHVRDRGKAAGPGLEKPVTPLVWAELVRMPKSQCYQKKKSMKCITSFVCGLVCPFWLDVSKYGFLPFSRFSTSDISVSL